MQDERDTTEYAEAVRIGSTSKHPGGAKCPEPTASGETVCPWVGCPNHLVGIRALDPRYSVKSVLDALDAMEWHCIPAYLDKHGEPTLRETADVLAPMQAKGTLTRERIRQIEGGALVKLRRRAAQHDASEDNLLPMAKALPPRDDPNANKYRGSRRVRARRNKAGLCGTCGTAPRARTAEGRLLRSCEACRQTSAASVRKARS